MLTLIKSINLINNNNFNKHDKYQSTKNNENNTYPSKSEILSEKLKECRGGGHPISVLESSRVGKKEETEQKLRRLFIEQEQR